MAAKKDGCRCTPCTLAARRHRKATKYRTDTGTSTYVDAGAAREHLLKLTKRLTWAQVEQRSGVHRTALRVLAGKYPGRKQSRRITRTTAAAVLAVTDDPIGTETAGYVPGTGSRRRLQALIALGWTAKDLGDRMGWSSRTRWTMTTDSMDVRAPITIGTRTAVHALYAELSMRPMPEGPVHDRTRSRAANRGWVPPLAWDEEALDDPRRRPRRAAVRTAADDLDDDAREAS